MTLRTKSGGHFPRSPPRSVAVPRQPPHNGRYIFTLYERFTDMKITVVRSPRFLAPLLRRMFGL